MGIRLAAVVAVLSTLAAPLSAASCKDTEVWLRGEFGSARFSVSVMDDPAGRAQGLMFVKNLPRSEGMLFVYEDEAPRAFWMKNTMIPLDILYFDSRGVLVNTAAEAIPGDLTPLPSDGDAQFVLEINGGLAARLGIKPGTEMRHPRIESPVWACPE